MNQTRMRRATLVAALFSVVALTGCPRPTPGKLGVADGDITIRFHGLMVFDQDTKDGKLWIGLHSGAEGHRVSIQVKGPDFSDFVEWGDEYQKDEDINLKVEGSPKIPSWQTTPPFDMVLLHPPSQDGTRLVIHREKFKPSFTINTGEVRSDDTTSNIKFTNLSGSVYDPKEIPREVVVTIDRGGQEAHLTGIHLGSVDLSTGKWQIVVRNNPSLFHAQANKDHFHYYYAGFRLKKNNDPDKEVDDNLQYSSEKKDDHGVLPTRPCIPISFQ